MRYVPIALFPVLLAVLGGCPMAIGPTTWLYVLQADEGVFTETSEAGVYTLDLTGVDNEVTWFTDRPWRDADTESLDTFIEDTWPSVLAGEGPTGAVAYQDAEGYWSMAPIKAVGIEAGAETGRMSWRMQMKGVPSFDTLRDVYVYLDDHGASETGEGNTSVFLHGAANISLEPGDDANVYTLRLSYLYPVVTVMETGAEFGVYVETIDAFIENFGTGDFVENPPNAAIQIEGPDGATHVIVVVLSEPAYDPAVDEMTYRAELLRGDPGIAAGPGVLFIDDYWQDVADSTIYKVLVNEEYYYTIWPIFKETPPGWIETGKVGTKEECARYIEEVWTDIRPELLRKKMEERERQNPPKGPLEVREVLSGSVTVFYLDGSITVGDGYEILCQAVSRAYHENETRRLVLEMGNVSKADSTSMGGLVTLYIDFVDGGGQIYLANVSPAVGDVLRATRLINVFQIYDTAELAVAAFEN